MEKDNRSGPRKVMRTRTVLSKSGSCAWICRMVVTSTYVPSVVVRPGIRGLRRCAYRFSCDRVSRAWVYTGTGASGHMVVRFDRSERSCSVKYGSDDTRVGGYAEGKREGNWNDGEVGSGCWRKEMRKRPVTRSEKRMYGFRSRR